MAELQVEEKDVMIRELRNLLGQPEVERQGMEHEPEDTENDCDERQQNGLPNIT